MHIREASSSDAAGIARVQERTWQAAYRHIFPAGELERGGFIQPARWHDRIARPPAGWATFVAELDGIVIGFASVGPSRDERRVGELYAIYVEPASWSTGTGRALIERAEESSATATSKRRCGCSKRTHARGSSTNAPAGHRTGSAKQESRWGVRAAEVRYRKS